MTRKIIDPTFGLDSKARVLVSLLSQYEPTFAHYNEKAQTYDILILTRIYYTGSIEPGWVSLIMYPTMLEKGPCKIVVFGEDVTSNQIIVQNWETFDLKGRPFNTITLSPYEQVYFKPQDIHKAGDYVMKILKEGYEELRGLDKSSPTVMQVLMKDD